MEETPDSIALSIQDTGVGIPEAERALIFERFHRVRESRGRSFEGTGIGLAMVQELAKLNRGTVEVASREAVGSTFTVRIPRAEALHADPRPDSDRVTKSSDPITRSFLEEAERWGVEPRAMPEPEEASVHARRGRAPQGAGRR